MRSIGNKMSQNKPFCLIRRLGESWGESRIFSFTSFPQHVWQNRKKKLQQCPSVQRSQENPPRLLPLYQGASFCPHLLVRPESILGNGEGQAQVLDVTPVVSLEEHKVLVEFGVEAVQVVEKVQEIVIPADEAQEEGGELRLYLNRKRQWK